MAVTARVIEHDPQARLDYGFDWSDWLAPGETITAYTVVGETGLTVESSAASTTAVTAWVTSGVGVAGRRLLTCHITTSAGRQDDRSQPLWVTSR